jgi:hypothetical protein
MAGGAALPGFGSSFGAEARGGDFGLSFQLSPFTLAVFSGTVSLSAQTTVGAESDNFFVFNSESASAAAGISVSGPGASGDGGSQSSFDSRSLFAEAGFNVIATANTRDRGVNEMSAALKRRFNFETVPPIDNIRDEMELVQRETDKLLARAGVPVSLPPDMTEVLVTAFHELRNAKDEAGKALEPLTTPMSTAEAISTGYAAGLHAWYYEDGPARAEHLVQHLAGTALKDSPDDLKKLRHYFQHVVKGKPGDAWKDLYAARDHLP